MRKLSPEQQQQFRFAVRDELAVVRCLNTILQDAKLTVAQRATYEADRLAHVREVNHLLRQLGQTTAVPRPCRASGRIGEVEAVAATEGEAD